MILSITHNLGIARYHHRYDVRVSRLRKRADRRQGLFVTAALLSHAFQLAYVTNDVDRAAALFRERYGTGAFQIMRDVPDGDTSLVLGLGYAGRTNIELIAPAVGGRALYVDWIADASDFVVRFHHVGLLIEDDAGWGAMRAAIVANGSPIAMEGSMPGAVDYLYADTVSELGHYLEYVRLHEGGRAMFSSVPGFPESFTFVPDAINRGIG